MLRTLGPALVNRKDSHRWRRQGPCSTSRSPCPVPFLIGAGLACIPTFDMVSRLMPSVSLVTAAFGSTTKTILSTELWNKATQQWRSPTQLRTRGRLDNLCSVTYSECISYLCECISYLQRFANPRPSDLCEDGRYHLYHRQRSRQAAET